MVSAWPGAGLGDAVGEDPGGRRLAAGADRVAGRHAHRAGGVGVGEAHPAPHQPVQVGRVDVAVAERGDRVEPLLVGHDEEDVRLVLHTFSTRQASDSCIALPQGRWPEPRDRLRSPRRPDFIERQRCHDTLPRHRLQLRTKRCRSVEMADPLSAAAQYIRHVLGTVVVVPHDRSRDASQLPAVHGIKCSANRRRSPYVSSVFRDRPVSGRRHRRGSGRA